MKKVLCITEYVIYILFVNLITFILRPMSWNLLSRSLINLNSESIFETLSNLVIFIVTTLIIAFFFKTQNDSVKLRAFFIIFFKKILWATIGIRLLTDIIEFAVECFGLFGIILMFIAETLSWFLIFRVISSTISRKKIEFSKINLFTLVIGTIILILVTIWYTCHYSYIFSNTQYIIDKYVESSFLCDALTSDFELQVIAVFFGVTLWTILFVYFGLFETYIKNNSATYSGATFVARMICLVILSFLFLRVKMLVLPTGAISHISKPSKQIVSHLKDEKIDDNYVTTLYSRISGSYDSGFFSRLVYKKTKVTLTYKNNLIIKFDRQLNLEDGQLHKLDVKCVELAYRYDFDAIAYVNNGIPFAIKFEKINDYEKRDDSLIEICEYLIKQEHFEAFEYSYKYLLKHDSDFITPYIREHQNDFFSDSYFEKNSHINPEYIKEFIGK